MSAIACLTALSTAIAPVHAQIETAAARMRERLNGIEELLGGGAGAHPGFPDPTACHALGAADIGTVTRVEVSPR